MRVEMQGVRCVPLYDFALLKLYLYCTRINRISHKMFTIFTKNGRVCLVDTRIENKRSLNNKKTKKHISGKSAHKHNKRLNMHVNVHTSDTNAIYISNDNKSRSDRQS